MSSNGIAPPFSSQDFGHGDERGFNDAVVPAPEGADVEEAPRQAGPVGADAVALNDEQAQVRPGVGAFAFGFAQPPRYVDQARGLGVLAPLDFSDDAGADEDVAQIVGPGERSTLRAAEPVGA
jgi:hypothetical protein